MRRRGHTARSFRIVFRYMIPRVIPMLIPAFVTAIPGFVFLEASLSILGLGDPDIPTWGKLLSMPMPTRRCSKVLLLGPGARGPAHDHGHELRHERLRARPHVQPEAEDSMNNGSRSKSCACTIEPPGRGAGCGRRHLRTGSAAGAGSPRRIWVCKSSLARAILRLLPRNVEVYDGCARQRAGRDGLDEERFRRDVRWSKISIVMQAAMNALNPVLRVADQVIEPLLVHQGLQRDVALARVRDVFQMVGVPLDFMARYAFELSGGMRQRVVLAMALVLNPHSCCWTSPRRRWTF